MTDGPALLEAMTSAAQRVRRARDELMGRGPKVRVRTRCDLEVLGSTYGRYAVCIRALSPQSVLYSFGVGEDVSFDLALARRSGARVHAFDPTPKAVAFMRSHAEAVGLVEFHPIGVADFDGEAEFSPPAHASHASYRMGQMASETKRFPVRRLSSIMSDLGHERIDVLKLDVEGAEYPVIADLLAAQVPVAQLAVEFHHRSLAMGVELTREAIGSLGAAGYEPVFISPRGNELTFVSRRNGAAGAFQ
jgi:FkbM family methyltransferase